MTLFHLRELWSANCGTNEEFEKTSLCICNIDNCISGCDKIVTASFNGTLRVFNVSLGDADKNETSERFEASDLLLEVDFKEPILQIASGLLLASNDNIQLAVLHPNKFCVYSISSTSGVIEHGTSYNILLIYEHLFNYKAVNMMLGSFGQIKGKEILCIQNMESALNFFENESFSFCYSRSNEANSKFPMEIAYVASRDMIIISDNLYNIECYRYQELAMSNLSFKTNEESRPTTIDSEQEKASINPEWSYSFGEMVLDIVAVCLDKWCIVLLGERNLCVLRDNGSLWFVKKFEVNPSCLCAYANETRDSVISIVGTHMHNLLIYQNECLKWATKTPFVPVSIRRGNFADIAGALVLLSENGSLMVGYLGTNPSLKIISLPQMHDSPNSDKIADELKNLKKVINAYNLEGSKANETDKKLSCYFDMNLLQLESIKQGSFDSNAPLVALIEISSMISQLSDVKVCFFQNDFFEMKPNHFVVDNFEKPFTVTSTIAIKSPLSLSGKLKCCIVWEKENVTRIVYKSIQLPFEELVQRENAIKGHRYWAKFVFENTFEDKASLAVLFEEIRPTISGQEISFHFRANRQMEATIRVTIDETNICYQVECSHIAALYRCIKELLSRLSAKTGHLPKLLGITINFNPIEDLCDTIETRLRYRNALASYQAELDKFSQHFRVLQKRILVKLKDKNPTSLSNFEKLLKVIHSKINFNVDRIEACQQSLHIHNYHIWSYLKTLKLLLKSSSLNLEKGKLEQFLKLISINQMSDFTKNWEEKLESNLLEVMQLDRDISNLAKVIDYEQNCMLDCRTLRATFRSAYQVFGEQSGCPIQIV